MIKSFCLSVVFGVLVSVSGFTQNKQALPSFEEYGVPLYTGKIKRPKWIR